MSHSTAARLVKEFTRESKDPNPAVKDLSPVSEDDLFKWKGWLQGINGSSYEGTNFFPRLMVDCILRRRMASGNCDP